MEAGGGCSVHVLEYGMDSGMHRRLYSGMNLEVFGSVVAKWNMDLFRIVEPRVEQHGWFLQNA